MSPATKALYLALGVVLLLLGLLGLMMPVLPGIVFLAAAVYVFSRASRRFRVWSRRYPRLRRMHYRVEQLRAVNWTNRAKLCVLMSAGAFVAFSAAVAGVMAAPFRRR